MGPVQDSESRGSDINGAALLSVIVHNQSFLFPYFSTKYALILLKSFVLKQIID